MAADNDILTSSADKKVSKMASDIKSAIGKVMDVASDKMWNEKHTMKLRERLEKVMAEINKANLKGDQKRADELQKRLSNMQMDIIKALGIINILPTSHLALHPEFLADMNKSSLIN